MKLNKKELLAKYIALKLNGEYAEYKDEDICGKIVFFYKCDHDKKLIAAIREHRDFQWDIKDWTILIIKE